MPLSRGHRLPPLYPSFFLSIFFSSGRLAGLRLDRFMAGDLPKVSSPDFDDNVAFGETS